MGARSADRLSLLPDEIILHIFSFIPHTEEIARTSVVSKRFRSLWAHLPSLCLGDSNSDLPYIKSDDQAALNAYIRSVDACFDSFRSLTLDSLAFYLPAPKSSARYNSGRWIRFAAIRSVRRLHLKSLPLRVGATVPPSIFTCQHLSTLDLTACALPKRIPDHFQGFRFLTDLKFFSSSVSDEPFASLLSRCPVVETLSIDACHNLTNVEFSSGRLKHLCVSYCRGLYRASFDAPNLESVRFLGNVKVLFLKRCEMLRDARISHCCYVENVGYDPATITHEDWERSLLAVSHTSQTLAVNNWVFQFVLGRNMTPMFKNLKQLEYAIDWVTAPMLRGLASMFHHCPNLEKLYVDLFVGSRRDFVYQKQLMDKLRLIEESICASVRGTLPSLVEEEFYLMYRDCFEKEYKVDEDREIWDPSECASGDYVDSTLGLKSVVIKAFLGTANEMKLLECLLSRANVLETLTIGDCRMRSKEEIHRLLADIPRASTLVQICEMKVGC